MELRRNRLPFFPGNFLGQLGFCKGLRLLLPLWGLISPVYTVEMLVQMVAKKTCLPDPMTWSLWNAERCRGATQVCPSWDKRTQGPPREALNTKLRRGLDSLTPWVIKTRQPGTAGDPPNKSAWGRNTGPWTPGCESSPHITPLAWVGGDRVIMQKIWLAQGRT